MNTETCLVLENIYFEVMLEITGCILIQDADQDLVADHHLMVNIVCNQTAAIRNLGIEPNTDHAVVSNLGSSVDCFLYK
jgi:hypothetical protein